MIQRKAKFFLSLLLTLIAILNFSLTAYASESSVTFENGKLIAFEPGSVYTESDLFDSFKGVMPGDIRTEEITIQNNASECDYIKVYLRMIIHDEDGNPISEKVLTELQVDERRKALSELEYMNEFLSQLSMKVWSGDTLICEESPDKIHSLSENIYLGSIRKGETIKLNMDLNVPIELDNKYSNRIGEVDWAFVIEGFDDPTPPPDENTMLTVRKVWADDGVDRPNSVVIHLLRDGRYHDEVELNQENHWAYTWDRLDNDYLWSVAEADVPEGYGVTYITEGNTTTITNTKEYLAPPSATPDPIEMSVEKRWDDNGTGRPDSVKVTLYNGEDGIESVWLGEWNNWSYTWQDLDGNGRWQIIETNIPDGYTPSYSYQNGVVTITNTAALIQTGQLSWPIPVLGGLGLLLITYGFIVIIKKRKNEIA